MSQDLKRVITGKVRLSYVHLTQPHTPPSGGEPRYSVTLLIPKSDVATKQRIDAAIAAAIEEGVQKRWNGVRPPQIPIPIYDGDGVRPSDGMPFGPECKGHWVMTASTKQKPEIVDLNLNPIIDATQIYSGMYAHVSVNFFAYNAAGKKGIGCGLGNVQKVADGEPLGGRRSAAEDFASLVATAPPENAQPYYGQPAYGHPAAPQAPVYPPQPSTAAPIYPTQPGTAAPVQIDPITGKPLQGDVWGI